MVGLKHHGCFMEGEGSLYLSPHPREKLFNGYKFIPGIMFQNVSEEAKNEALFFAYLRDLVSYQLLLLENF